MKQLRKLWIIIGVVCVLILGYRLWMRDQMAYSVTPVEHSQEIPQIPETVTDVRVSVVPREYKASKLLQDATAEITYLQIWYEYEADGKWYRYPSENYDLIGIFGKAGSQGWKTAYDDHMVKIGSKLLICLSEMNYPDSEIQIRDSLETSISETFTEYYGQSYGYFSENVQGEGVLTSNEFWPRHYLVLDYMSLPEDYELEFVYRFDGEEWIYTLTAEDIRNLLNS